MKTDIYFWSYLAQFFLEWEMFYTKVVEKIKTHILSSVPFFFRKSCLLWDNVEKFCRAGDATDDSMAHVHFILGANGYKRTLTDYVTFISFLLQQWIRESAWMLRYAYITY
jgi:hypothetical protein